MHSEDSPSKRGKKNSQAIDFRRERTSLLLARCQDAICGLSENTSTDEWNSFVKTRQPTRIIDAVVVHI